MSWLKNKKKASKTASFATFAEEDFDILENMADPSISPMKSMEMKEEAEDALEILNSGNLPEEFDQLVNAELQSYLLETPGLDDASKATKYKEIKDRMIADVKAYAQSKIEGE